jgi:cell division transport system permease protein
LSWRFFYTLREGLDGLRRAKLASFIALMSMSMALFVMGVFAAGSINLVSLVESVRARIEFEVFIDNSLDDGGIEEVRQQLMQVAGVAEVNFISKEQAEEIFKREFGLSGQNSQNILEILETNPLPASFRISLQKSHQRSEAAQNLAAAIAQFRGVDEVVYRRDLMLALDRYVRLILVAGLAVGVIFCIGSILLVINDVRLVIYAKRRLIETMQLVGATAAFVRRPLLVQGFLQGSAGGVIAAASLYLLYRLLALELGTSLHLSKTLLAILVLTGMLLGLLASYWGARKYIR